MLRRFVFAGIFVAFTLGLVAVPASSQDKTTKTTYIYVSEWAVPRSMWSQMAKLQTEDRAFLDKFVADGTITGYGEYTNLVHQEGQPTHGDWLQSNTQAGIVRVLAALAARPGGQPPVLSASKHWDFFLASDASEAGGKSGIFTNAYLRVLTIRLKVGQGHNFDHLYKTYILPIYKKLLSDGTLLAFGVDGQEVISENAGDIDIYTVAANAEALDTANAALQAAFAKNPGAIQALQSTTKRKNVRSSLSIVNYMKVK